MEEGGPVTKTTSKHENTFKPQPSQAGNNQEGQSAERSMFEKIINKLLEYNEKINNGKEISVVEYLKRIEPRGKFMQ